MAGKIPNHFIDELMMRVDIVDVIDRRVPLTRKGKEYQACCPFHEEKTPSFTVSPDKQFYHCFGCGAHGTAIGFLMEYGNLGFIEAVEELADGVGLEVPRESGPQTTGPAEESPGKLLKLVEEASFWFQNQLREHEEGKQAIAYLKGRGLDGRIAASFGIGFAPDSWDALVSELGTSETRLTQLQRVGLVVKRDKPGFYDRFRGRIIFPIEDHRGRVVAFGGRILGEGEPKYLNSPETPLFHKGAELYGLHRARREIGGQGHSIVVEGYMDVVSLAQFGVANAVATLGTATTRTHLQRLFRLAPEIVFCFDGDRAGRDAAWKAMQVALPEIQDGRQVGFLFLPEGEDPDTVIRGEGEQGFRERVKQSTPLPDFLLDSLVDQVDMGRMDGRARLVSLARPLIGQLPRGALREMVMTRLSSLSGLSDQQLGLQSPAATPGLRAGRRRIELPRDGQISPLAFATSLLLQFPWLAREINDLEAISTLDIQGAEILLGMIEQIERDAELTTARLLESFRDNPVHSYLEKLASRTNLIDHDALSTQFNDILDLLLQNQAEQRRLQLIAKSQADRLDEAEKRELRALLMAKKDRSVRA